MATKSRLVWEELEPGMQRAHTPEGWIVRGYDQRWSGRLDRYEWELVTVLHVSDPDHTWLAEPAADTDNRTPKEKDDDV